MSEQETHFKRLEVDAWTQRLRSKAREYAANGISLEEAEERAFKDIQREIRRGRP